jgi:N-methylhydantoinase A/oxoprolinase/acetone carboxylase beta subunit
MIRLGIDVGGTNTDCVLLNDKLEVIAKIKSPTTPDIQSGISNGIKEVLRIARVDPKEITHAMLGTTQATNAIAERKGLDRVGVIRLGKPYTTAIPPLTDWPADLAEKIGKQRYIITGGYEFTGEEINPLNETEIKAICAKMAGKVDTVAITGVFSPVNKVQEKRCQEIVREELNVPVTISSEIGSLGLLERENAATLNAALYSTARRFIKGFIDSLEENEIDAEVYICQNDGTLMSTDQAERFPVLTIGCGPTNSIRGAAYLSHMKNGIVIDIGGTTTDVGVIVNGFPRQSSFNENIGGVRTNFPMPDVSSVALGGGTLVKENGDSVRVGPESLGYKLMTDGIAFGGTQLTTTDITLANGHSQIIPETQPINLDNRLVDRAQEQIEEILNGAVDQMRTSSDRVPLVLVGGGSIIATKNIAGASTVDIPDNSGVANAVGAALGEVSGEVNSIYSFEEKSEAATVDEAKKVAINQAIEAGADPDGVDIISVDVLPLAYLPQNAAVVKIKASGKLKSLV